MLHFFRRYQKFFFLFITVIIVITFVFFGTFQAMVPNHNPLKETAFFDLNNKKISRLELEAMVRFLSIENPSENLLNDGVMERHFFTTALGYQLFTHYKEKLRSDMELRLCKEKLFIPYVHPVIPELSAEATWSTFAPNIKTCLETLQSQQDPLTEKAFSARINLYLAERKFPGNLLKQFLFYQAREYENCPPDYRLYRTDLSLFGYRNLIDWFGKEYMDLAAMTIFNTAAFAVKQGYKVTREETLSDIMFRLKSAIQSKQGQQPTQQEASQTLTSRYKQTLAQLGLDEDTLLSIWQKMLLFKRVIEDIHGAAWPETSPIQNFFNFSTEYASIELFQLPSSFVFSQEKQWEAFNFYLDECYKKETAHTVKLLQQPLAIENIEQKIPELICQQYTLMMNSVDYKDLEAKISLKQLWDWELEEKNWSLLTKRFPELKHMSGETKQERSLSLESLDEKKRALTDTFAKSQILIEHPEWLEEHLKNGESQKKVITFQNQKLSAPLAGIYDAEPFKALLDENDPQKLKCYTQDGKTYFRISIEEKPKKRLLTFTEAQGMNILSDLLTKRSSKECNSELGPYRCISYLEHEKQKLIKATNQEEEMDNLEWKIQKKPLTLYRHTPNILSYEEVMDAEEGTFSQILFSPNIGYYFYHVLEKKKEADLPISPYLQIQKTLGHEIQTHFFDTLFTQIDQNNEKHPKPITAD